MADKDKHFWKILDSVLRLEVTKGHLKWKITDVARAAGVQRTLVYYYFGKSKEGILKSAMAIIGDEFFGLSPERMRMWSRGQVRDSIVRTRELVQKAPHMTEFFFHWRHQKSPIRDELLSIEKRYLMKLKTFFPHLSDLDRQALYSVFFGLCNVPDLTDEILDHCLERIPILGTRGLTEK
jgi:AcrR family transcriptional regulator